MTKEEIINRIDELCIEKDVSKYRLMQDAEISSIIYQWKKNTKRDANYGPSLRSIEKICAFFNISLAEFFSQRGDELQKLKIRELEVSLYKLSDEQIDILQQIIKHFICANGGR